MNEPINDLGSQQVQVPTSPPVRWLNFYTYVAIPLGIVQTLIQTVIASSADPVSLIAGLLIGVPYTIFLGFLGYGLAKRRLWGWRLNWVFIFGRVVLFPPDAVDSLQAYAIWIPIGALIWILPNWLYFRKRRSLFH